MGSLDSIKPYERNVYYYETDRMGIVHHSNYIRFMEEARCAWLESIDMPFEAMEEKGVIKILDDVSGLSITYIEAKENLEKFNQAKFREEHPDLFDEYVTLDGKKSAYITIKIKW